MPLRSIILGITLLTISQGCMAKEVAPVSDSVQNETTPPQLRFVFEERVDPCPQRRFGLCPTAARGPYLRANPVFTAPIGKHDWLNKSVFTSTIEPVVNDKGELTQVVIRFYEIM